VSPTQINFLVPDVSAAAYGQQALWLDAVVIRDGARFDTQVTFYVSPGGDFAVFQAGYDCDFSLSLTYPEACGYSPSSGQYRVPIGAVTDASGNLITSQNPVRQGQVIILWATGLGALRLNSATGLLQQSTPSKMTFGVLQPNPGGGFSIFNLNWTSQTPIWAGESPQFVGLDQINVNFPTCTGAVATVEQRYDLVLNFEAPDADANLGIGFAELYMPFIISPGERDCQFGAAITVTSSANPTISGQPVTFTAVSLSSLPGTVTFFDGASAIAALGANVLSFATSTLAVGSHSITAKYSGEASQFDTSTSSVLTQIVTASATITVSSSLDPSTYGQMVTFMASVAPSACTGAVVFLDGASPNAVTLGAGTLNGGEATLSTSSLSVGSHPITVSYSGDGNCSSSISSYSNAPAILTQTVGEASTNTTLSSNPNPAVAGNSVVFTATVSPSGATGTVALLDGGKTYLTTSLSRGQATFSTNALSVGSHLFTVAYSGDGNYDSSTSSVLAQTVTTQ
jgi:uncharacterized protein (TIGR03437 family)